MSKTRRAVIEEMERSKLKMYEVIKDFIIFLSFLGTEPPLQHVSLSLDFRTRFQERVMSESRELPVFIPPMD
jgi:hypothetical protein